MFVDKPRNINCNKEQWKWVCRRKTFDCAERMLLLINASGFVGIWCKKLNIGLGHSQKQTATKSNINTMKYYMCLRYYEKLQTQLIIWSWQAEHTSTGDPFLTIYRLFCEIGCNNKGKKKKTTCIIEWLKHDKTSAWIKVWSSMLLLIQDQAVYCDGKQVNCKTSRCRG